MPHLPRAFLSSMAVGLAVLLTLVWIVSYARPLELVFSRIPQSAWLLDADRGRIRLLNQRISPPTVNGLTTDARTAQTITVRDAAGQVVTTSRDSFRRDAKSPWWFDENAGNHILNLTSTPAGSVNLQMRFLCAPIWFFVAVLTTVPAARRARAYLLHRHRTRAGLCPTCGYDLRATPGRCPECGVAAG